MHKSQCMNLYNVNAIRIHTHAITYDHVSQA